ncbi:aminotransferase [Clostridia bacterium]|nr:aminotransferase [Clostridia bacterium]
MKFDVSRKMKSIKPSAIREIFKSLADPEMISLAAGNPSPDAFPTEAIAEISAKIYRDNPVGALQYGITEGYAPLIEKVKSRLKSKFNIDRTRDQTIITTGGQQGIDLLCKVMCDEGDVVLVEKPTFIGALNAFKANGARVIAIETGTDGFNMEVLEKTVSHYDNIKLIYTIPTFHNPLGITTPLQKRKDLLKFAASKNIVILEDNPYGDLRYSGDDIPTLKSMDDSGIVVYCSSFSKIIAPGIRIGYLTGHEEIISKVVVAKQVNDVHSNAYFQLVVDQLLAGGINGSFSIDAHIEKIRGIYGEKCALMLSELEKAASAVNSEDRIKMTFTRPDGGLFLWVTLPVGTNMDNFVARCISKKVAVVPGKTFHSNPYERCTSVRLNFSMPSKDQIINGVRLFGEAVSDFV